MTGNIIRLGDVAKVVDSVSDERFARIYNVRGRPTAPASITLAVSRQPGTNTVEVAQAVRGLMPQLKAELPGSIDLIPTYDRSLTIIDSVNDVKETLFIAFVLVVLVIFVFLGRAADTLIPVVALPLSLLHHLHRDAVAQLQHRQSLAARAHARHRLPRR